MKALLFVCFFSMSTLVSLHGVIVRNQTFRKIELKNFDVRGFYGDESADIFPIILRPGESKELNFIDALTAVVDEQESLYYSGLAVLKELVFFEESDGFGVRKEFIEPDYNSVY